MARSDKETNETADFEPVPLVHSSAAEDARDTMDMNKPTEPAVEAPANAAVVGDPEYVNDAEKRPLATVDYDADETYVSEHGDYHDPEGFVRGT